MTQVKSFGTKIPLKNSFFLLIYPEECVIHYNINPYLDDFQSKVFKSFPRLLVSHSKSISAIIQAVMHHWRNYLASQDKLLKQNDGWPLVYHLHILFSWVIGLFEQYSKLLKHFESSSLYLHWRILLFIEINLYKITDQVGYIKIWNIKGKTLTKMEGKKRY